MWLSLTMVGILNDLVEYSKKSIVNFTNYSINNNNMIMVTCCTVNVEDKQTQDNQISR